MSLALGSDNISFNRIINKVSDALRPVLVLNKNSGATTHNGAYWNSTYPGRLYFDGSNDYCRMENIAVHRTSHTVGTDRNLNVHMGGSSAGTISWWWKLPYGHTPGSADYMFSINTSTGANVILVGFNYLKIKIHVVGQPGGTGNTYSSTFSQSPNTWYLYTIVIESSGYKFYINGVEKHHYQAASSSAYLGFNTNDRWTLGGEWDSSSMGNETAGECQHFAVWDIALSEGAIAQMYSDGVNYPPSIVMGTPNYISTWNTTTIGCPAPTHRITNSTSSINKYNTEWYNNTWIFNGSNAYIRLEGLLHSTFNGSNNMSFSCWVWHENSTSSSSSDVIYSDHENTSNRYIHKVDGPTGLFRIYYSSSDKFRFNKHVEYNWTHYAFTRERVGTEDFLRWKIYINGKKVEPGLVHYRANNPYGSNSDDNSFESYVWTFNSNTRYSLGHEWDSNASDFFKGMLKNVQFWSSVLTDEQVAGVFRAEFGRSGISMNNIRSIEPKMTDNGGPSSNSALSFNSQFRNHTVKDGDNQ